MKRYSGVLIRCQDKVLLCKRSYSDESRPGEWSIPCGHQEKNENKLTCAVRELFEETNIKVDDNDLNYIGGIKTYDNTNNFVKGILSVFVMYSDYEIYPDLHNAKDGKEHEECGYFSLEKLPKPIGVGLKEIIQKMV